MSALLMIRDETATGKLLRSFSLSFPTTYTTIRDVIAARVRHEVGGDAEKQIARALEAFERNGFIVLIGDQQAESLDEGFLIQADTEVSFVKLVQLVGG